MVWVAARSKTTVSFGVASEDVPLDFLTDLLDHDPTDCRAKGPYETPRGTMHAPLHFWRLMFFDRDIPSTRVDEYLDKLLEFLQPRKTAIDSLLANDDLRVEIRVWETQYSDVAGVRMDAMKWRNLMEFCKTVQYQIVSLSEDDPESSAE